MDISIFGGVGAYYTILNSIASVFNNSSFVGGLLLTALLLSLMKITYSAAAGAGASGMSIESVGPGAAMLILLTFATFLAYGPRTTVNVTDKSDGSVRVVANVPLVLMAPAWISNQVFEGVSGGLCTALSTVNGQYTCDSTKSFFSLPKILLSPMAAQRTGLVPDAQNFATYMAECLSSDQLSTVRNSIKTKPAATGFHFDAVLDMTPPAGYTTWFTMAANGSIATTYKTCEDANSQLKASTSGGISIDPKLLRAGGSPVGTTDSTYTDRVSEVYGTAVDAQKFYTQTLLWAAETYAVECGALAGDTVAYSTCVRGLNAQVFQWSADNAGDYSFIKTVLPETISYVQGVFFALTPLFVFFWLCNGYAGFKGFYTIVTLFLWVNTWYPTALVVDFVATSYIQDAVASAAASPTVSWPAVYQSLQTLAGLSGVMMSSVFGLTFAVISGSAMGLASAAKALSPGDTESFSKRAGFQDEMKVSPRYDKTAQFSGNDDAGGGFAQANAPFMKYNTRAAASQATASSLGESESAKIEASTNASKGASHIVKTSSGYQSEDATTQRVMTAHMEGVDRATQQATEFARTQGWDKSKTDALKNAVSANVGAGIPGFAGVQQDFQKATGIQLSDKEAKQFAEKYNDTVSAKSGDSKTWQRDVAHALRSFSGKDTSDSKSLDTKLTNSMARSISADKKYEQSARAEQAIGAGMDFDERDAGAMLQRPGGEVAMAAITSAKAQHSDNKVFDQAYQSHLRRLNENAPGMANKAAVATLAALQQVGDMKSLASVVTALAGSAVMDNSLTSTSNKGVGAEAQKVPTDLQNRSLTDVQKQLDQLVSKEQPALNTESAKEPGSSHGPAEPTATAPQMQTGAPMAGSTVAEMQAQMRDQIVQGGDSIATSPTSLDKQEVADNFNVDNSMDFVKGAGKAVVDTFKDDRPNNDPFPIRSMR